MSNNWYNTDSNYGSGETAVAVKRGRKPRTGLRIFGGVAVLLLIIVASSLLFAGGGAGGDTQGLPPENWTDFLDDYYQTVQQDVANIDIERAQLPIDFSMALEESHGPELSLQELYQQCANSIVAISGYIDNSDGYNWGTGVILSSDGLVITNTHVIDGCQRATVTLYDDSVYEAKLVGADVISDIALLKIEATGLPAASFGDSAGLAVGEKVAAIGNPLGETFRLTLTDGIISAIERGINYNGHSMTLLQTNTALNEGNSGGALFNMYGQVIGVTNMKMMSSSGYSTIEGIGFAIPNSTVKSVVDSLVVYGQVMGRPSIGITVGAIPETAASHYEIPNGLYVMEVAEGSDAESKGMMAGDIVTAVNGQPVYTTTDINDIKNGLQVGDTMEFTVWREGEILTFNVVLKDTNDVYK